MKNLLILLFAVSISITSTAQSEMEAITTTLNQYINGSTGGQPDLLKEAFHSDLNLYSVRDKELKIWSGKEYILDTKEGKPTGEGGKIISIDYENTVAVAKVEISHPESPRTYIDYFLLLKIADKWTIVHKAYTKRTSNKKQ